MGTGKGYRPTRGTKLNGLSRAVLSSISKIRTTFIDRLGNRKCGVGTGVWLHHAATGNATFVTNRHNVDVSLHPAPPHGFVLDRIEIEFKTSSGRQEETAFYVVKNPNAMVMHPSADVALLSKPDFDLPPDWRTRFHFRTLTVDAWLANQLFFAQTIGCGAELVFVGYPQIFCDQRRALPIARHAIIASEPSEGFVHNSISMSHAVLVSGLSFGGGSGSPVFCVSRGLKINTDNGSAKTSDYCPTQLVGIMTGHFQESNYNPRLAKEGALTTDLSVGVGSELEKHSGLSYFTKSTAILEILGTLQN